MDLTVGIVPEGSIYDEVLFEMLDHEGVTYMVIDQHHQATKYPVVLLPRFSERSFSVGRKHCEGDSNIVAADQIVDLDFVLSSLKGENSTQRDSYELKTSNEGGRLVSTLREAFFAQHLPLVRKWFWPHMATMCCVLTHDVDWLEYSPFHKQVVRQSVNPIRLSRLSYHSLAKSKNYGWNVPEIAELEEDYGYRSTFLFQTEYQKKDHLLERSVELLKQKEFEVELHGARSSHRDADSLQREIDSFRRRTGENPRGVRYHILKFDNRHTWEMQSKAGLTYDATFCYNRFFGFRAGICFPYHPFSRDARISILELPTSYMDWTSLHRNQGPREQAEVLERIRAAAEQYHGILVVNFHNTYLNPETFPSVYNNFKSLLETAKRRGYWVPTAYECALWWQRRSETRVNPRIDAGEVVCTPSGVDVVVEKESGGQYVIPAMESAPNPQPRG